MNDSDDERALLNELRSGGFAALADEIEERIALGKREVVKASVRREGGEQIVEFAAVSPDDEAKMSDQASSQLDIRISEFTSDERRRIILEAIRRTFIEPELLLDPLKRQLGALGAQQVSFVSPIDESERFSLADMEKIAASEELRELRHLLDTELRGE